MIRTPYTLRRRNARIEFRPDLEPPVVRKTYHATYNVHDERIAYERAEQLTAALPNLRPARLLDVADDHELVLEFVAGTNLQEAALGAPSAELEAALRLVTALLCETFRRQVHIDCDPANLIWTGEELVIVDPVVVPLPLRHLSAVIFLHGLFKTLARAALRLPAFARLRATMRRVRDDYCRVTGAARAELDAEWADYLDTVVRWNRERAVGEGRAKWVLRHCTLIPAYRLLQLVLRASHSSR